MDKYNLDYVFWRYAPNYFVVILSPKTKFKNKLEIKIYVSKNGGQSFNKWKPQYNDERIFSDDFRPIKNVLLGISMLNNTFFYADTELKIFSIHKYEKDEMIIPSHYDSSHVMKIIEIKSVSY
ncbi:hypothetical protein RF11_14753 [Thelohanellus kitauei]|uniref:Sortilin N-terminal domain-containing protein n=1 Tax=Thelohanellus kitauei TaxID=669202 RepID=A0A0C2MGD6_THEKT|nr:hypothetical protein RF11_14753 [Thelohanellus kitauei]